MSASTTPCRRSIRPRRPPLFPSCGGSGGSWQAVRPPSRRRSLGARSGRWSLASGFRRARARRPPLDGVRGGGERPPSGGAVRPAETFKARALAPEAGGERGRISCRSGSCAAGDLAGYGRQVLPMPQGGALQERLHQPHGLLSVRSIGTSFQGVQAAAQPLVGGRAAVVGFGQGGAS